MTIREYASLRAHNTLCLAASARAYASVSSRQELAAALEWASSHNKQVVPWGQGSNVVLAGDLDAVVVCLTSEKVKLLDSCAESVLLRVAAGANWHSFVHWTLQQGYSGLENLALIPGTVGAAPVQNIGAYGVEIASFVEAVHGLRLDTGLPFSLSCKECVFGYRDSIFKNGWRDIALIDSVDLRLRLSRPPDAHYPALEQYLHRAGIEAPSTTDVFDAVVAIRQAKLPDPATTPNAGSFFKNPVIEAATAQALEQQHPGLPSFKHGAKQVKVPAAWLIERCGWKGWRDGNVGVHSDHALVLVNYGGGSGNELLALAAKIAADVHNAFGIRLAVEPRIYGAGVEATGFNAAGEYV